MVKTFMIHKSYIKCKGCAKQIPRGRLKFCPHCLPINNRMLNEHISEGGRKYFWAYIRKFGDTCSLSGVSLELKDDTSPWYLVFRRVIPSDKAKILPAAAVFNGMKSALTKRLFKYYIIALDDWRKKHIKVHKKPIAHWRPVGLGVKNLCPGCGRRKVVKGYKYCARCSKANFRMHHERFSRESMQSVWDYLHAHDYIDYYTGMKLNLNNTQSPWYMVFDHLIPRDPKKIVPTSGLINEMKCDLTEDEFWYLISELANFFRNGTPVRKIKLVFWSRPYRAVKLLKKQ